MPCKAIYRFRRCAQGSAPDETGARNAPMPLITFVRKDAPRGVAAGPSVVNFPQELLIIPQPNDAEQAMGHTDTRLLVDAGRRQNGGSFSRQHG